MRGDVGSGGKGNQLEVEVSPMSLIELERPKPTANGLSLEAGS